MSDLSKVIIYTDFLTSVKNTPIDLFLINFSHNSTVHFNLKRSIKTVH